MLATGRSAGGGAIARLRTTFLAALAMLAVALFGAGPAAAAGNVTYSFALGYGLDAIINADAGPTTGGFGCCQSTGGGFNQFTVDLPDGTTGVSFFGTTRLGIADGPQHLAVAVSTGFPGGQEFQTAFATNYTEADVIGAINVLSNGDAYSQAQIDAAVTTTFGFKDDLFAAGASFAPTGPFSLYSYSTGQLIATGVAAAAPEAGSWAMMIAGFGIVGGALRRRRSAIGPTAIAA